MKITVKLNSKNTLSAKLNPKNNFNCKLNNAVEKEIVYKTVENEKYEGNYVVTPKAEETQVLNTKNKLLINDITVKEVPIHEVSNVDGTTVYIGREVI